MGVFGQLLQRQGLLEMQVDVAPDCGALAVAGSSLGFCLDSQGGVAHKSDDENFHVGLTDILVACIFQFHFPENIPKTGGDLYTFKMIQNTEKTTTL